MKIIDFDDCSENYREYLKFHLSVTVRKCSEQIAEEKFIRFCWLSLTIFYVVLEIMRIS